jgi:hypothetical protein
MSLLVRAVSTSELRVDQAAAAFRRTSRGNAAGLSAAAGALEDRGSFTDGVLEYCQLVGGDRLRCVRG